MGSKVGWLSSYEERSEAARLWRPGSGDLVRLRTWDIFDRVLPVVGSVLDVGGGAGTHARYLADRGYGVTLVDPVGRHLDEATDLAAGDFRVVGGDARALPVADGSFDVVLLQGPLYHLLESSDRVRALHESRRVLADQGVLLAEVMTRHAFLLDAAMKGALFNPDVLANVRRSVQMGQSADPARAAPGTFMAHLHRIADIEPELTAAGFETARLIGVEGPAWMMGRLVELTASPEPLLDAMRLLESDPELLGASAHVIAVATKS